MIYKTPEKINEANYIKEKNIIISRINNDMIIDLSNTRYMSSAGIQTLLWAAKTCEEKEYSFSLINPQPIVEDILNKTGLNYLIKEEDKNKELIK